MAVVHEALDLSSGRRVALKRMRSPEQERRRSHLTGLFEREFLTLAQLTHPRVVAAYDYGIEHGVPYYTMELLDGGDVQNLAPLSWQKACAIGRDVCSALSLLHSRRMVYRDLSPRNVRCTEQGQAKLIDFGAMSPMGPTREVVGTPPFVPPEALNMMALDARSDLYGLGATLYYALTQRHAFPARSFGQLWELWRVAPPPPSAFNAQVPEALDRLVLELIHRDPAMRPQNAAEVMLRLSTIAELPADENLSLHQAYLSAPTLVGRSQALASARELMQRALAQHGGSLIAHGAPGAGRSRFLDECALEGKLLGLCVVRVDAGEAEDGDYGLVRLVLHELSRAAREPLLDALEPHLPVLGHALPELLDPREPLTLEPLAEGELHARVQPLLKESLYDVAQERPLLIAVDNAARADEPSLALLAKLAQEVAAVPLLLVSALASEELRGKERSWALALLAQSSRQQELPALDLEQTGQLLSSIFGDVPNLPALAAYAEQIAAGSPRDTMRLAQHLVNERIVRFTSGSWSLPERMQGGDLPSSMAEELGRRIARLSAPARAVGYAFALEPKLRLSLDECLALSRAGQPSELLPWLRELLDAGVVVRVGPRYRVAQLGFAPALESALSVEERIAVHARLAQLFEMHGDGLRSAQHLLHAGQELEGLTMLVRASVESELRTNVSPQAFFEVLAKLPHDWLDTYALGLRLCDSLGRPESEREILLSRMNGYICHAVRDTDGFAFLKMRLDRLERAVGLDLYATLPESMEPSQRVRAAFDLAKARHAAATPEQRGLDVRAAVPALAASVLGALGTIAFTSDASAYAQLPSLAPLAPISPTLALIHQTVLGVGARIQGRGEEALAIYDRALARLAEPDQAGLRASEHLTTRLRLMLSAGAIEACMGLTRAAARAEIVRAEPGYATQGLMLRHLHELWQGHAEEAERTRHELEQLRAFSNSHHGFDGQYLLAELCAHALADDLTRVKQATDVVSVHAAIHRGWRPVMHFGRAEHQRIRGDFRAALSELESALALMHEHPHQIWACVAGSQLRTLLELGQVERAVALGESYLRQAEQRRLGYQANYLRMPLSLALARTGDATRAQAEAEITIQRFSELGSTGLNLAAAYETRALVALEAGDAAGFEHFAALSLEQCRSGNRRLLRARLARAQRRKSAPDGLPDHGRLAVELSASLMGSPNDSERARRGLEFLSRYCEALGGVLYAHRNGQLERAASFGQLPAAAELDSWAREYFAGQLSAHQAATSAMLLDAAPRAEEVSFDGGRYLPTLLGHDELDGYRYTGLALLVLPSTGDLSWLSPLSVALSRSLFAVGSEFVEGGSGIREVNFEREK